MRRLLLASVFLVSFGSFAYAACGGGANGTPTSSSTLLTGEFQDGQSPGSIVPGCVRDIIASSPNIVPVTVSAAGTTQGTATVLTAQFNIVTSVASGTGVKATAGYTKIWNAGANALLVYPISGAQLDANGTNIPVSVGVGGSVEINMTSPTQGYAR
jgi:hypothetical protein